MNTKYFNKWEADQAISLIATNPFEAKLKFEAYLKKYPNDYITCNFYCSVLIMLKELDKAEKYLKYIKENIKNSTSFKDNPERVKKFDKYLFINTLKLLSFQERYQELSLICEENNQKIKEFDLNSIAFYAKKKLGKLNINQREKNSYLFRQIVEYKESDFLEHLSKHLLTSKYDFENDCTTFSIDFPIDKILIEIKKYMLSDKQLYEGLYQDTYIFKYNGCGRDGYLVDYFQVICFHNTTDIITMFPSKDSEYLPHVDLNYLIKDEPKVKRKSQIDKFNQKYKR